MSCGALVQLLHGRLRFLHCLLALLVLTPGGTAAPSYEQLCDEMIQISQRAAAQHNSGDEAAAAGSVEEALFTFDAARALQPAEPQAYLNAAVFLGNINRMEESLELWDAIPPLLPDDVDPGVPAMVKARRRGQRGPCCFGRRH